MATPDHLRQHGFSDDAGVSLNRLMKDNFRFSSDPEPGLEMVDILTNATRRALNGRLGEEGWKGLPSLMIHRREQYVSLLTLRDDTPVPNHKSYVKLVGEDFSRGGRSLLTNRLLMEAGQT